MFENGNPPVVAEPPSPEAELTSGAAAATELEAPVASEATAATAESEPAEPAPAAPGAPGDTQATAAAATDPATTPEKSARERSGKRAKRGAHSARAQHAARKPGSRAEEYVTPTPEELAGIPSASVRAAVESGHPVEGKVIGWNQGGFHVVVDGITGFCPRSSMELGAPHEPAKYLEQVYAFRVLRVEEKGHRLVLSRTAMLREERRHRAEEMRRSLQVGQVLAGRVVALADFGAFVDLGGVEGLVHVSELRHARVGHPSEVLQIGQELQVKVIKLGSGGERVSLSAKALEADPWQVAAERWPAGSKFTGKVLRKSEFGWFVELAQGVEGLLHPSQLPPGLKPTDPSLEPGSTIEGWVRELDLQRKRVSLALREMPAGNPWEGVESRYAEGAKVVGTIEKLAPFGAFVLLEPGLTGLLPTSEMGLPRGAAVGKAFPVGKKVTLQVAQVDARRKRISLTLEGKTLEGSRSDYQNYLKRSRRGAGMSALAAAFDRLKNPDT